MAEAAPLSKKENIILFTIILGTFMTALDATIVAVALPTIGREFSTGGSTADISWILLAYTLTLCCFILLWGKIGTNIGYKNVFVIGIAVFSATSLAIGLCGFIDGASLNVIIILRAVQGIGAGMAMAMGLAMVSTYLSAIKGRAVGYVTLAASAGTAFGPALGGVLCNFHWSYIFFINVPIGVIVLILALTQMDKVPMDSNRQRIDVVGAALMFVMMFALIFYLNEGGDIGWLSNEGIALIAVTAVAAWLLMWYETNHAKDPVMPMRLIRIPDVMKSNFIGLLLFAAMAGSYLLLPYYLEFVQGYSTVEMGLILIANSVGMMAVGPTVGKIADRTGINSRFLTIGCGVAAIGFFMMMFFSTTTSLIYILLSLFVMGMGMGMGAVSSTNLAFGYCEQGEDGLASGLVNTLRQAGSSAGVAVINCVFMAGLVWPAVITPDFGWMMPGFKHAFFVAVLITLIAFVLSSICKDKKVRCAEQ